MPSLPFQAIFIDTSICLPAWPQNPGEVEELIALAEIFTIPVIASEAVLLELRSHCLRDITEALGRLEKERRKLSLFIREQVAVSAPTINDIELAYDLCAAKTRDSLNLQTAPFTSAPLEDLFQDAINHRHPFASEGRNFQDAVVLRSAVEICVERKITAAAFISKDKDYSNQGVTAAGSNAGVSLQLFKSVIAIQEELWPFLQELLKKAWESDNNLARTKLVGLTNEIEVFLQGRFTSDPLVHLKLISVGDVVTGYVTRIKTPLTKKTTISFSAEVRFHQEPFVAIDRNVAIEGWADFENGDYGPITLESAELT